MANIRVIEAQKLVINAYALLSGQARRGIEQAREVEIITTACFNRSFLVAQSIAITLPIRLIQSDDRLEQDGIVGVDVIQIVVAIVVR